MPYGHLSLPGIRHGQCRDGDAMLVCTASEETARERLDVRSKTSIGVASARIPPYSTHRLPGPARARAAAADLRLAALRPPRRRLRTCEGRAGSFCKSTYTASSRARAHGQRRGQRPAASVVTEKISGHSIQPRERERCAVSLYACTQAHEAHSSSAGTRARAACAHGKGAA
ncbi:hypothetical protein HDU84_009436 [Entophlyctis sp. JEL0112]|nr:hypothetical protein HDU84_009436 [Entophlyctis sp. JEL0112]